MNAAPPRPPTTLMHKAGAPVRYAAQLVATASKAAATEPSFETSIVRASAARGWRLLRWFWASWGFARLALPASSA